MPGSKGGEANQDVRGRLDCQEEMLAAIYPGICSLSSQWVRDSNGPARSLHLTSGTD